MLDDSARVLSRVFKRARQLVQPTSAEEKAWFRDRHRQAHRWAWKIAKQARKTQKTSPTAYADWLKIAESLLEQAQHVQHRLGQLNSQAAHKLSEALQHYVPLVQQVVWQTHPRVVRKLKVAAGDKLVSLFEEHTDIICRAKAKPTDTEFGHKVWFCEVEGGFICQLRVPHFGG